MKLRNTIVTIALALTTVVGAASANQGHMSSTPDAMGMMGTPGATPGMDMNMSMGAFYLHITNSGDEADRLVSVDSTVADVIEIHDVEMKDGVMKMVPQLEGVEIPAGETLVLKPGSFHIMLIGLTDSLMEGDSFVATLHFEKAGDVEITVPVYAAMPEEGDFAEPVKVGETMELSGIWGRQAPKLNGMATPMATPDSTPAN